MDPQEVTITASDDLLIEGNVPAEIVHSFSSADGDFEGLSETHSVTARQRFQRPEPDKLPSEGNNYVIYDSFSGPLETSSGVYDLGGGGDLLRSVATYGLILGPSVVCLEAVVMTR